MSEFVKGLKDKENDLQYNGNAFLRLMGYLKPYIRTVIICFVLVLILTALELYRPMLTGNAIDLFITAGDSTLTPDERWMGLVKTAGVYIVVMVMSFMCNRAQYLMIQEMGQKIVYTLRMELMAHVQSLSMRFFDTTPVGRIVTRITNDTEAINDLYSNIIVRLFRNVIKVIGLMVVMFALDVKMALLSLVMVPVVAGLTFIFRRLSRKCYQVVKSRITALNTFLSEHLSGMRVIQIFHREKEKCDEFEVKNKQLYDAGFRELMIFGIFRPLIYLSSIMATAIILGGGSSQVLTGVISIGTLYMFTQYISQLFQPIQELAEMFTTLQSAIASAEKIFTLMDVEPIVKEKADPVRPEGIRGRIEFDHVWFAYETKDGETPTEANAGNENWVLRDVSFVIEPGQKVAFVGATGAGKSSILNLIGRYYDIQKGAIRIDGIDIRDMSREQIRAAIGQVQQDVFLFTGDIKQNIRLRDDSISDETIRQAAVNTNASHFIERLPNQYDERVTERGSTFSAGQRQLISFARTLAYDPTILILDEATANIDTETEQWIQDAVKTLMEGRTSIMVAHRLSTIQHCDRIIVMHHGKIRESGTHQELLEQDGIYKKLYQLQLA
ncbi:MAG: ABC transporter ATP-binding protein [Clostridiales bacterium]|nr:ABC transporter ATP-binding protein [Clostridiales bacterium]